MYYKTNIKKIYTLWRTVRKKNDSLNKYWIEINIWLTKILKKKMNSKNKYYFLKIFTIIQYFFYISLLTVNKSYFYSSLSFNISTRFVLFCVSKSA